VGLGCAACGGESNSKGEDSRAGAGGNAAGGQPDASGGLAGDVGTGGTNSFVPDQGCASDAACQPGQVCLRYAADGPAECVSPSLPITSCETSNDRNECCSSADCTSGACFSVVVAAGPQCGLGGFDTINQCLSDRCQADSDCPQSELCSPPGFGPVRECLPAACRTDADCTASPGGACIVFGDRCCFDFARTYRPKQLACVYPKDGCQEDDDCPSSQFCVVEAGRARCSTTCQ